MSNFGLVAPYERFRGDARPRFVGTIQMTEKLSIERIQIASS